MIYDHFFEAHMNARFWYYYRQGIRKLPPASRKEAGK